MDTDLDHKDELITRSVLISDIVIGLSDGLIIPFALAAGLSAAVNSTGIIVIAGICLIAAGSIAMGFGGYFTGKTEQNNYHSELKKEHYDVKKIRHHEVEETKEFFCQSWTERRITGAGHARSYQRQKQMGRVNDAI